MRFLVLFLLILVSNLAHAQVAKSVVKKFEAGIAAAKRGSYKEAIDSVVAAVRENREGRANAESIHTILSKERIISRAAKAGIKKDYIKAIDEIRSKPRSERIEVLNEARNFYTDTLAALTIERNIGYHLVYSQFEFNAFRFFPSRNTKFSSLYYNELKEKSPVNFLRSQFLTFGDDIGALSSEIVSGHALAFRLSISTSVARVKLEDADTAEFRGLSNDQIQEFVNSKSEENLKNATLANVVAGGGLLSFKMQVPLFNVNGNLPHAFKMDSELVGNLSGQFAKVGTSVAENDAVLWGGFGSETRAFVPFVDFKDDNSLITTFGFFAEYDIRRVWGSGSFYSNLQIDDAFWMNELKAGLYANGIQISYTNLRFSNSVLDGRYENRITIAFAPN
jgi:hypothetical protein